MINTKVLLITILMSWMYNNTNGQVSTINELDTIPNKMSSLSYTLGPDDVLFIKVFDNPDLSGDFKVATDGSIVYPLLGQVKVGGMGAMDVQQLLTELLKKDYLYHPIVSVEVKVYKSQVVYILGFVGKSGAYYLDRPTKLFDLLTEANVLSKSIGKLTNGNNVRIIRQASQNFNMASTQIKDTSFVVSIYQFLSEGKKELNIALQHGDIIYIPTTQSVHVIGEVKKPGSFNYEEGMTVLKAISLAGGRTSVSSQKNIIIKRIVNNKETKIKVVPSDLLLPDDIIEIPLSIW